MDSLAWGSGTNTFCEKFMEDMTGCGWQGVSAIAAWNDNQARVVSDPQPGDAVYFGPAAENGGYGHVGIVTGPDAFVSVTDYGVKVYPISVWVAPRLGYVRYWA